MKKYTIRVIEGSLTNPALLNKLNRNILEELNDKWIRIVQVNATLSEIKQIQKLMIKHYDNTNIPWYLDGYEMDNKDKIICAFGADDGNKGKIFLFNRSDKLAYKKVKDYGLSKGIPLEQLDFLDGKLKKAFYYFINIFRRRF